MLLVLASAGWDTARQGRVRSPALTQSLELCLQQAVLSRLPVVALVAEPQLAVATRWLARRDVIALPESGQGGPPLGAALAAGLGHRPQAPAWLLWSSHAPRVQASTVVAVARALRRQPLVRAHYQGLGGQPLGFAAEFYSDLMRVQVEDDLQRLLARFPADPVEVDDPGVTLDVADAAEPLTALPAVPDRRPTAAGRRGGNPA